MALCPPVFDCDVLPFDEAAFVQPFAKCSKYIARVVFGSAAEKPDQRLGVGLSHPRRRPREQRAREKCAEFPPLHLRPHGAVIRGSIRWLDYVMTYDSAPEERVTKERYFA